MIKTLYMSIILMVTMKTRQKFGKRCLKMMQEMDLKPLERVKELQIELENISLILKIIELSES